MSMREVFQRERENCDSVLQNLCTLKGKTWAQSVELASALGQSLAALAGERGKPFFHGLLGQLAELLQLSNVVPEARMQEWLTDVETLGRVNAAAIERIAKEVDDA